MESVDPTPASSELPGPDATADEASTARAARARCWGAALLAGLLAGAGAWLVGESGVVRFQPGKERVSVMGAELLEASPRPGPSPPSGAPRRASASSAA
ncbi:MAG: hypothetical protein U0790_26640 [Isosphaeraceae bacterium]